MANFKTFTNASAPYEGKKIAIDMDRIACFFEDVLKADEELIKQYFKEENYSELNNLESKKFIDNLKSFNGEDSNVTITNKEQAELYFPQNPKMFLGSKK